MDVQWTNLDFGMIRHIKQYEIQQSTYFEGGIGDDNNDMLPRRRCHHHDRLLHEQQVDEELNDDRSAFNVMLSSLELSHYHRWTSPLRCGYLHQSNSVSQSRAWSDPWHHVPKCHDAASVSIPMGLVAMSSGTGNAQTDGSNGHLS